MSSWVKVSAISELSDGALKEISLEGHSLLLARIGDQFFATDNKCPHMGAKLSEGNLVGKTLVCPKHHAQYNLEDGQVIEWAKMPRVISTLGKIIKGPQPLKIYPVKVEKNTILVQL
ncbi:MAG: Rieske (2Fe-2S) protein [Chloroflexota bacterium]|nr:Rieske (2Fe-2S) protein [Chloroflexota bacterium]